MTSLTKLSYLAFIIISFELMLMMYIFMLQPKQRINRLFAVYMLILSASTFSIFVASTSPDTHSVYIASQTHTLAVMTATPLLWLLIFNVFIPHSRLTNYLWFPLLLMAALPLALRGVEALTASPLLFAFEPEIYEEGYVSIREILNGRIGGTLYFIYLTLLNSLLILPITFFAISREIPNRLQRAARVLLIFTVSVALLYIPWLNLSLSLRSMFTPLFAAAGAAWVMRSYRFFSPIALATKQVVDTVTIGLLVFDDQLDLMDANAYAVNLLPIQVPQDIQKVSLQDIFNRLWPSVENPEQLLELKAAVDQAPSLMHQQEIVLRNDLSTGDTNKIWLSITLRSVYNDSQQFLGCSCTIEDLTVERRTQAYITQAHKAIEQYAYNQALLNDITQAAISAQNFDENLNVLASRLAGLFDADHCYISLWDEFEEIPRPAVVYGEGTEPYLTLERQPDDFILTKTVCHLGQAISIDDIHHSPHVSQHVARSLPSRGMLALPMVANERIVGALLVGFKKPRQFSPEEVKWGEQIARQLTLAISKNQLLATEQEQRILLEALQTAGQALIGTLDSEQVLDRILDEIARVVPYDTVNFALIDKGVAHIVRRRNFGENEHEGATGAPDLGKTWQIAHVPTLNKMYTTKRPLRIPNTMQSEDWAQAEHVQSWMGVPIIFGDEPIAFLMVDKMEPDFYQAQHEKWLVAFANQATLALKHAQLFTEIQRRVTELEALSTVSTALRSSDTVPNILQAVLQAMVEILSARVGVAFLMNEDKTAVVSQASFPTDFYPPEIQYRLGEGITGHVAQTGKLHTAVIIHQDPYYQLKPGEPEEIAHLRSTIALPLISEEGILGVIHLGLDTVYEFADDEISTLKAMSNIVANGLQRIRVMQTLEARVASRTFDLETANERLQELDKLKTKFIADVSHELRTPVANLSIYINLLKNGNPQKQAHYVSILQQQANRLTNLVEATLGLSQLELGNQNHTFTPIALNPIIEEVLLGHQARADVFGITLKRSLQPDLPLLLGNKTQLVQLLTNLLTNGIHYNEKRGEIIVETFTTDENQICLRIADDGIGIDERELPHLFDRFYRGQRTGQSNIPGTGLGLAIVKEIVALHQGDITVESKLGFGTAFMILLPICQPEEEISEFKELA